MNFLKRWWSAIRSPRCGMYHKGPVRLITRSDNYIWAKLECDNCKGNWITETSMLLVEYRHIYHEVMGTKWISPHAKSDAPPTPPVPAPSYTNSAIVGVQKDLDSGLSHGLDLVRRLGGPLTLPTHKPPMYELNE